MLWVQKPADAESYSSPVAAYFRSNGNSCQFRLDFLDLIVSQDVSILLRIWMSSPHLPSTLSDPDYETQVSSTQPVKFYRPAAPGTLLDPPQVFLSPDLDTAVVQVNRQEICQSSGLFFNAHIKAEKVYSTPLLSIQRAALSTAQLLLTFWDTLPAATPLQLLRQWDGAHTGPFGQRHGLKILLEAVNHHNIPIFLLDLTQPVSLGGLDLLGEMDSLRGLVQRGLVNLATPTWGASIAQEQALTLSTQSAVFYHLFGTPFVYGSDHNVPQAGLGSFSYTSNPAGIRQYMAMRILPLPYQPDTPPPQWIADSVSSEGLSNDVKFMLLALAVRPEDDQVLVLGGSLSSSSWGDITVAGRALDYIAAHPWIQPIWPETLLSLPLEGKFTPQSPVFPSEEENSLYSELVSAPRNQFTDSAWTMYLHLSNPSTMADRNTLLSAYLPYIQLLIAASRWANQPGDQNLCQDLDQDGSSECILSNQAVFLVVDPRGGRIEFAAGCREKVCTQWIGSTAQMSVGLSDYSEWNLTDKINPDPQVIPGGLADPGKESPEYIVVTSPGKITLTHGDQFIHKEFTLQPGGFQVRVSSKSPVAYQIPIFSALPLPPLSLETAHTVYQEIGPGQFTWGIKPDHLLQVQVSGTSAQFSSFLDTVKMLKQPEDPDQSHPLIDFLPMPVGLLQLDPSPAFTILFSIP